MMLEANLLPYARISPGGGEAALAILHRPGRFPISGVSFDPPAVCWVCADGVREGLSGLRSEDVLLIEDSSESGGVLLVSLSDQGEPVDLSRQDSVVDSEILQLELPVNREIDRG